MEKVLHSVGYTSCDALMHRKIAMHKTSDHYSYSLVSSKLTSVDFYFPDATRFARRLRGRSNKFVTFSFFFLNDNEPTL